jgi:hypothetical protein
MKNHVTTLQMPDGSVMQGESAVDQEGTPYVELSFILSKKESKAVNLSMMRRYCVQEITLANEKRKMIRLVMPDSDIQDFITILTMHLARNSGAIDIELKPIQPQEEIKE